MKTARAESFSPFLLGERGKTMTIIQVKTADQVLSAVLVPKLAPHNQNSVKLTVDFDSAWAGYGKSAVFYTKGNPTPYEKVLDADYACMVPAEVLAEPGYMFITIKGVKTSDNSVKASARLKLKVSEGMPLFVVSEPTEDVYKQLLAAYSVIGSRLSNAISSVTTGTEVTDIRVDADGTTHATAGDAVREQTAVAPSLASFILGFNKDVVIDASAETITFPDDTLIMGYGGKWYQLTDSAGNTSCSYAMGTTAVNVVYQISTGAIFAQAYSVKIDRRNQILLCSIRKAGWETQVSISCNYTLIKDGVTYNSLSIKEATRRSSFLAPLITGLVDRYAVIDTNAGTITFPDDTLIIDPCGGLDGNGITYQLSEAKGNTVCKYRDYTGSSAVKIYYNPETDALEAAQYNIYNAAQLKLILLATLRVGEKAVAINIPYVVDGLLNGVDYSKWVHDPNTNTVKAINHRGYNTEAPENTLSAFRLSKKNGFKYVECDVSFTSDGYAVLLHDSTIDRTSNGTGSIADLTFEAVRALDFGSWFSDDYAGEQIPTFEEFIALCKHLGLHPYIELKEGTEAQIKGLVEVVKRYGMKGKVTWISFSSVYLAYIKAVDPKARLGFIVGEVNAATINTIKKTLQTGHNEVFADCACGNVTEDAVALCADADIPLEVWTLNIESALFALDPYVSGVTSDNLIAGSVFYDNNIGG